MSRPQFGHMRRACVRCAAALLLVFVAACGKGQDYPARPVNLIVPFPAGGSSDLIARVVSEPAGRALGQQIVIENRPGAGGNIGTEAAARAAPDGYTLIQCTIGTCAINLAIYQQLPYDLERDFAPIVLFGSIANVLTVNPEVKANSVAELVALAKKHSGKLTFGSSGYGSSPHLSGELFKQAAGIDILHVPYRGSAPAITDLRGGQIDMFFDNTPSILPHIKAGALRALAITGAQRSPLLPDVPTMQEAGFEDFVIAPWFGVMTQKNTPAHIIGRLSKAFNEALSDPAVLRQFADMGVKAGGGSPEEFHAHIRVETTRWGELVRARAIRTEGLK
ncbi:MAG: Bug family tripartite tricarboxylate transporter substrate binding protein [Betaproteobacteria bacterium]